jgi:hypothetical protein
MKRRTSWNLFIQFRLVRQQENLVQQNIFRNRYSFVFVQAYVLAVCLKYEGEEGGGVEKETKQKF